MRSEAEITEHDRILAREAFGLLWGKNMSDVNFVEAVSPYIAAARREGAEEALGEAQMRTHILRKWDRKRLEAFALHLLGDRYQEVNPLPEDLEKMDALDAVPEAYLKIAHDCMVVYSEIEFWRIVTALCGVHAAALKKGREAGILALMDYGLLRADAENEMDKYEKRAGAGRGGR